MWAQRRDEDVAADRDYDDREHDDEAGGPGGLSPHRLPRGAIPEVAPILGGPGGAVEHRWLPVRSSLHRHGRLIVRHRCPDRPLGIVGPVELQEEMSPADAVLLMSSVPERI